MKQREGNPSRLQRSYGTVQSLESGLLQEAGICGVGHWKGELPEGGVGLSCGALGEAWSLEAQSRTWWGLAEGSCLGPENKMDNAGGCAGLGAPAQLGSESVSGKTANSHILG